MAIKTKEATFESLIEHSLIENSEYIKGESKDYNKDYAIDTKLLFKFIKDSQPKEWEKLIQKYGDNAEENFLKRLNKALDTHGMLYVLRHGVDDIPARFSLCFFPPSSKMNKTSLALYERNILSVNRQVYYSNKNKNSIDMVLFVNGLPFSTMELKNQMTGQSVEDAKSQYMRDRDPRELLLSFKKRCLVHFAVDTDEVWMTTCLSKKNTRFLPFNKGNNGGKGNPPCENGCRTSYLWEEILQKDSILDIIGRFIHLKKDKDKKGKVIEETLIFPRYHQLDVVRKLTFDARENGTGRNYLIQHSAGSGKSNSIAWLSHQLSSLHDKKDKVIFNSIIVITDRVVLDKQLQETIYQFEHEEGVVIRVDKSSSQLADALNLGKKIIITTMQKFPFILENVNSLKGKRFAVIVDEAHSSQSGETSKKMKAILGDVSNLCEEEQFQKIADEEAKLEENTLDSEDEIVREISTHGKVHNLSFFAFTATPKPKTLETFGTINKEGIPEAFHLYSMKQAIEEGFIHDVLKNYMTYETYFKVGKAISGDPRYEKSKANKALGKYLTLHPHNLAQKTQIIIEHFRTITKDKIGGKAKAMVVTSSRLHAVRYYKEFEKYIKKMGYEDELGSLIAFSGTVDNNGDEYTETSMNGFKESELPKKFSTEEYQVLLVAEKYQTGFDQPLLHTMFIDKKLGGVKAVQTLSRVNRTCFGKEDTFILDFANTADEIRKAFSPYYEQTTIETVTDANIVYDLKIKLDEFLIYSGKQVNDFAKVFFKPSKKQDNIDFGRLNSFFDGAVEKYKALEEAEQSEFKSMLSKFVKSYSFISGIVKLDDKDMHKFFAYARLLLKKLPAGQKGEEVFLEDEVNLQYYRLQKTYEDSIVLNESTALYNTFSMKASKSDKGDAPLSKIIKNLNEKFASEFSEEDALVLEQIIADADKNERLKLQAKNNTSEKFEIPFNNVFMDMIVDRMEQNQKFCERILDDDKFGNAVKGLLGNLIYEKLRR